MYTYTRTLKKGAMVVEITIAGQFDENMHMFTRKKRPAKFPPTVNKRFLLVWLAESRVFAQ